LAEIQLLERRISH
jgi:hypothetical protein